MDIDTWIETITGRLKDAFDTRLFFVGLKGSPARGKANEGQDVSLVVILDRMDGDDLVTYRSLLHDAPSDVTAFGFFGSRDSLRAWPRFNLFQLISDTTPLYSSLPHIVIDLDPDNAAEAAQIGASNIYHAVCHAMVFDSPEDIDAVLEDTFKDAFFPIQAAQFVRGGIFIRSKTLLSKVLDGDEARILEIGRDWENSRPENDEERKELASLLIHWAEATMVRFAKDE